MNESVVVTSVSFKALQEIDRFLHLPIKGHNVNAPYFNNQRAAMRGGLRVLIGKGSPTDMAEEAFILSLKDKVDLTRLNDLELKAWLIKNHVGIDCSGFVYYVLNAELRARGGSELARLILFQPTWNPLRKLIRRLRPVENIGVGTLAHDNNSTEIALGTIVPGDMIILLRTGRAHRLNHVLLVHQVESRSGAPAVLYYTHSFSWSTDGRYNHGVRQGKITITNLSQPLLAQTWEEQSKTGTQNETYVHAREAEQLQIRRLRALTTRGSQHPLTRPATH